MKNILIYTLLIGSLFSCEKILIGADEPNNPERNFELFWNDFDQHYALFGVRGIDWQAVYDTYRPQVDAQTTDVALFEICKKMIAVLDDSHTFVGRVHKDYNKDTDFFASGSEFDEQVEEEFSLDLVKEKYLENIVELPLDEEYQEDGVAFFYAKLKNQDIGYVYFNVVEFVTEDFLDKMVSTLADHKAIIMDVRNNTGGSDEIAREIAGRFADGEHFVYTVEEKNGPNENDFAEKKTFYTEKRGPEQFTKPLIVLTDRITVSAGEVLLLHLKAFDSVTQIGDATAGDFSDTSMRRFLPNGFQYQYSIMKFLQPDGSSLDGVGHIPDIQSRNTIADIKAGNDKVMQRALAFIGE